jgi:4-amino-4-deoxy-L-arabinose transferase-like glycosyltransferase
MWQHWMGGATFYQDPLYAYLLAGFYRVFGPRLEPVLAWQALLGLGIAALLFVIGRLMWDETVGLTSAALAALYAPLVFYESTLLRGVLQAFVALSAVCCATLALRRGSRRWWLAAGACAGVGFLAHGTNALLAVALGGLIVVGTRRRKGALTRTLAPYVAGMALALAPLIARNVAVGLPPWSTGAAAAYGAHSVILSHAVDADPGRGFPMGALHAVIFAQSDAEVLPTVRATLATHPGVSSWLWLMARKALAFFDGWENSDNINFYYFLVNSPALRVYGLRFWMVLPLFALGAALSGRRILSPLAVAVACGFVTSLVAFTSSRVRLTAALAMIPFAAAGIVETVRRLRDGAARTLAAPAAALAAAAVLAAAPWWPRPQVVRPQDYRTGNLLALGRWQRERERGDTAQALRIVEKQLSTEPLALRRLDPAAGPGRIPEWTARLAGSFLEVHRAAVRAHLDAGHPDRALHHAERAQVLGWVAEEYARRSGAAGAR